jgi:hypothetical protein
VRSNPRSWVLFAEDFFQIADGQGIELIFMSSIKKAMKGFGYLIFNEYGILDFLQRRRSESCPGFDPQLIISSASDKKIAFFKLVRQSKRLDQLVTVHLELSPRPSFWEKLRQQVFRVPTLVGVRSSNFHLEVH